MAFSEQLSIEDNQRLRVPQHEGWLAIHNRFTENPGAREVAIVLPVGCGKSWSVAELNRRVNERVGGRSADRQNFTLDQLEEAHTALPELVQTMEQELTDAAS